jgi:addiction module RelE/StbE family toxin
VRKIERAAAFKRDYRRAKATSRYRNLDHRLTVLLELLVNDRALPSQNRDHALTGIGRDIGTATSGPTCC